MRIDEAILDGKSLLKSSLEAEVLLAYLTGLSREYMLAHGEHEFAESKKFRQLCRNRADGIPLAYLTNHKEFFGLDFYVDERVLIPRPETELLVEEAIERGNRVQGTGNWLKNEKECLICDVGTGSGCIAISLAIQSSDRIAQSNDRAKSLPNVRLIAVDISSDALTVARVNAKAHGVSKKIEFKKSDLLKNVLDKPITGIVANLPYIANGDKFVDKEVRKHEPKIALFSGETGLELFEKLFRQIATLRQAQGDNLKWLICEVGAGQKSHINTLIKKHFGNIPVMWKNDLAGIPRVFTLLF